MPPSTRKGKAKPQVKAPTKSQTKAKPTLPGATQFYSGVDGNAETYDPSSSRPATNEALFEKAVAEDGCSGDVYQAQQRQHQRQPPTVQPKRRGRPPKESSAKQDLPTSSKTGAQNLPADRRSSISSLDSSLSAQPDNISSKSEKKTRLRARNREAAHKCRVRKQRGIEDLQTQEAAIGAVNQCLKAQHAELRGEVLMLKNLVLQHGGCGCSFIESYIEDAAASLSQRTDSFSTSRQGSSSSAVSPTTDWTPVILHGSGSSTLSLFEEGSNNAVQPDWDTMGSFTSVHDGGHPTAHGSTGWAFGN